MSETGTIEEILKNMEDSMDDENGSAIKNEPLPTVKNESDSSLRRSSRAPKKKSYQEEFECDETPSTSNSNGTSPKKKVRTSIDDSFEIKNEEEEEESEVEVLDDEESDEDFSGDDSEPEKKKGKPKKTSKTTAAKKRPVKKPTKKQNKKTESSESDEDFANAEKTTKKKTNKTTQEYKCITKSTEYFMRGDVMWYIAIRREGKREPGIKSFQRGIKKLGISQLSELRKDEFITMELRVALEDTACKESHKKFATKCVAVGKSRAKVAVTGHEFLHEYSDSDENLQRIIKIFENQVHTRDNPSCRIIYAETVNQRKLYQRVLDKISDISQHFEYLTGVKALPEEDNNNELSPFDFELDPEESFNVSHNESVQIIDVVNANSKSSEATTSATPSGATLFPTPATSASESTEPSPWDDLKTKFRTEDVIKYFKENQSLKDFWNSVMNGERKSERHDICLTDRDRSFGGTLPMMTNLNFLSEKNSISNDRFITTSIILNRYRQESKIVSDHPKLGKLSEDMQKRYFELVLTPEGCMFYLRSEHNLSEEESKEAYEAVKLNIEDEEDEDFTPALNDKPATPPPSEDQESDNDSDMIPDFDSDTG